MLITIDEIIARIDAAHAPFNKNTYELIAERDAHFALITKANDGLAPKVRAASGIWRAPVNNYCDVSLDGKVSAPMYRANQMLPSHKPFRRTYGADKNISTNGKGFSRIKLSKEEYVALLEASGAWSELNFKQGKEWLEAGVRTLYLYLYTKKPELIEALTPLCRQRNRYEAAQYKGVPLRERITASGKIIRQFNEPNAFGGTHDSNRKMVVRLGNGVVCTGTMPQSVWGAKNGDSVSFDASFALATEAIDIETYFFELMLSQAERDRTFRLSDVELTFSRPTKAIVSVPVSA